MAISRVQKEILASFFEYWAHPLVAKYAEKPDKLPVARYYLALAEAIRGPFSSPEILEITHVDISHDLFRYLRSKNEKFREISKHALKDFSNFFVSLVLQSKDDNVKRLVLSEVLVRLPGFDLIKNPIFEMLQHAIIECEKNPVNSSFKKLHDMLLMYRDIVRLAHDSTPPEKWPAKEEKLAKAIIAPLDRVDFLVCESELEPGLKQLIGNLCLSLQFLASYSKVVF
jgi:hypothetical protein